MNQTMRRVMTTVGATAGILALSTGSAFAHYCYRTDVPENSKASNGAAWMTQQEAMVAFAGFLPPGDCATRVLDHIEAMPAGTLFMGPGLLAGGAVRNGHAPDGFGHLFEDARTFPECAWLFEHS
jgi:hypothetical protein